MTGAYAPPPGGWLRLNHARIADAIAMLERGGDRHHAPLFRALAADRITLVLVHRGAPTLAVRRLKQARRPVVVLLLDDDGLNTGPETFPAARAALRWCRALVLHAAGGEAQHYECAVELAEAEGSVAVIECGAQHAEAWFEAARRAAMPRRHRGLVIWPTNGVHPVAPAREALQ